MMIEKSMLTTLTNHSILLLDPRWYPLLGPDEEHEGKAPVEVDSEEDFLGEFIIRSLHKLRCVCTYLPMKVQYVCGI
jgi:hypothetical protein